MWSRLTYEKRTYVLIGVFLALLLVGYQSSISKTLESYREFNRLNSVGQSTSIADFSRLQRRYQELDSTYSLISGIDYDKLLISEINDLLRKNKIQLAELQIENIGKNEVDVLTLTGSYKELVKTVYYFEKHFSVGRVFSANYYLKKNNKTKVTKLYLDLYVQRLETKEDK